MTGRTVATHAKDIKRLSEGERIEQTICDHDAEDRATLEAGGVFTVPAWKSIKVGIEQVKSMMAVDRNNKTQVYFFRDALAHEPDPVLVERRIPTSTVAELEVYAWPKGIDGRAVKELPVDLHNHGCDSMRYLLATLYAAPIEIRNRVYAPVPV